MLSGVRTVLLALAAAAAWAAVLPATPAPQAKIDPQTGRAVGAKEMAPDILRALIARGVNVIVIDVRDEAQFAGETIKGAVHVPFDQLEARLKEIPRGTILAFT